jgi:hypothetical protein
MPLHLETARLRLRPWAKSDTDDHRAFAAERGHGCRQLNTTEECDVVRYYGLTPGRASVDEPEVAYELFRLVHGRGYTTEAVSAVLDAAISTGRKQLRATVPPWNAPSFRVLEARVCTQPCPDR